MPIFTEGLGSRGRISPLSARDIYFIFFNFLFVGLVVVVFVFVITKRNHD